jgi:hypothetical protein
VLIPNATTGVNTVLWNLHWGAGKAIVFFFMIYDACEKAIVSVSEGLGGVMEGVNSELSYPVEDGRESGEDQEVCQGVKERREESQTSYFQYRTHVFQCQDAIGRVGVCLKRDGSAEFNQWCALGGIY